MSYGISFFGADNTPILSTFGDNYRFLYKTSSPNYLDRRGQNTRYGDGYQITVPSGLVPLIFIHSPVGRFICQHQLFQVNSTTWWVSIRTNVRVSLNCTLYIFVKRVGFQTESGWGLSTYGADGGLIYTNSDDMLPLSVKTHLPDVQYFTQISRGGTRTYSPSEFASSWSQLGIVKPCWYCPSVYRGFHNSQGRLGLCLRINSDNFTLGKLGIERYVDYGTTAEVGVSPIGIPFIDGAMYD